MAITITGNGNMIDKDCIAAVVLAGGAGRRVLGSDKGLLVHKGRRLIESVTQALEPQVGQILISANRNLTEYQSLGCPVLKDAEPNNLRGPLAGVEAAIESLQHSNRIDFLLVCPCDTPNVPTDFVARLIEPLSKYEQIHPHQHSSVVHDGTRQQSLHCLIARQHWASLLDYVENGGRAVYRWHKKADSIEVDFSDRAGQFLNINRLVELAG